MGVSVTVASRILSARELGTRYEFGSKGLIGHQQSLRKLVFYLYMLIKR